MLVLFPRPLATTFFSAVVFFTVAGFVVAFFSNNMEPRVSAAISAYTKLIWGYRPRSNCPVIF